MHRFGRPVLLNEYAWDLRIPKWGWLLKVKTFRNKNLKSNEVPAKTDTLHRANTFLRALRTTLILEEQLRLVVDATELCPASVAAQVFTRAQGNI